MVTTLILNTHNDHTYSNTASAEICDGSDASNDDSNVPPYSETHRRYNNHEHKLTFVCMYREIHTKNK